MADAKKNNGQVLSEPLRSCRVASQVPVESLHGALHGSFRVAPRPPLRWLSLSLMHLTEKMLEPLKAHLIRTLAPLSTAEPDVLATYIIALLKNDKNMDELKEQCIANLTDFLKDDTKPFVNQLFDFLNDLEKNGGESRYQEEEVDEHSHRRQRDADEQVDARMAIATFDGGSSASSHRRRRDEKNMMHDDKTKRHRGIGDGDAVAVPLSAAPAKQRCRDYDEQGFCVRGDACPFAHPDGLRVEDLNNLNPLNFMMPQMPLYSDPTAASDTSVALVGPGVAPRYDLGSGGWMGAPRGTSYETGSGRNYDYYSGGGSGSSNSAQRHTRGRGRGNRGKGSYSSHNNNSSSSSNATGGYQNVAQAYHSTTGYTFEQHLQQQMGIPPVQPVTTSYAVATGDSVVDLSAMAAIDPAHAAAAAAYVQASHSQSTHSTSAPGTSSTLNSALGGKPKAPRDTNTATLSITNIPREVNTIEGLSSHFKKFGTVVNIQVHLRNNRATVQFAEHHQALAALRSPEAVLGNRFIKVLWVNKDAADAAAEIAAGRAPAGGSPTSVEKIPKPASTLSAAPASAGPGWNKLSTKPTTLVPAPSPSPSATPTPASTAAAEKARLLQKTKDDLRRAQLEQQKKLLETITKLGPNINPKEKADLLARLHSITASLEASVKKDTTILVKKQQQLSSITAVATAPPATLPTSPTSAAKRKALLDRELDTISSGAEDPTSQASAPSYLFRGRGGRGRGVPRGRGGRGGASVWSMNLDNRPSTILVQDVPEELRTGDPLRTHFASFGNVVSFNQDGANVTVQYSNRREAEQAMARGRAVGSHALKLAWSSKPNEPAQPADQQATAETSAAEDGQAGETAAAEGGQQAQDAAEAEALAAATSGAYTHYVDEPEDEDRSWKRQ